MSEITYYELCIQVSNVDVETELASGMLPSPLGIAMEALEKAGWNVINNIQYRI